ncbi:MAG: hypothetical protein Q4C87_01320 [Actinomycetaceae bacterium]|nr:hypothetical protein [Actinomycetaceae bacterium]
MKSRTFSSTILLSVVFLSLAQIALADECTNSDCSSSHSGFEHRSDGNSFHIEVWEETVVPGQPGGPIEPPPPPSSPENPPPAEDIPAPAEVPQAEPSGNAESIQIDPKSAFNPSILSLFTAVAPDGCQLWITYDPRMSCLIPIRPDPEPHVDMQPFNWDTYPGTDTKTLISSASTMITLDGAGLEVAPFLPRDQFTNIHTVVYTTRHEITKTVRLYGKDITITFRPTYYVYNFNDGTQPIKTTSPGHPWPNMDLIHYYKHPVPTITEYVTLTTTWNATTRNPWTGKTETINKAITTTETSRPFRIRKLHTHLTDTAEELMGH